MRFWENPGPAQRGTVTIGLMNNYQAEILSGLQSGDCVIVAPESTLSAGTQVASSVL